MCGGIQKYSNITEEAVAVTVAAATHLRVCMLRGVNVAGSLIK